mmetsp:Transcript_71495/g.205069  ORF Transcript_71495/g.205069 Transcript_71495/m.205069 type:complete len:566 (-) Transcript_71495:71-1768(-)
MLPQFAAKQNIGLGQRQNDMARSSSDFRLPGVHAPRMNLEMEESSWPVSLSPLATGGKLARAQVQTQRAGDADSDGEGVDSDGEGVASDGRASRSTGMPARALQRMGHQGSVYFASTENLAEELNYPETPKSDGSNRTRSPPELSKPRFGGEPSSRNLPSPPGSNLTSSSWRSSGYAELPNFPREKDPVRRARLMPSQSAPMLPVCDSPFQQAYGSTGSGWRSSVTGGRQNCAHSSWYSWRSRGEAPVSQSSAWRPLGGTWRERSNGPDGPIRENADDGNPFIDGCVPQWGRGGCKRRAGHLEHELTWTYYHMKKHSNHPLRMEVGESLPLENVPAPMRLSKKAAFNFWENLRPPFRVSTIERISSDDSEQSRDGELFRVIYVCGIDYCSERAYGETSENSTYDNLCYGVATMRIPDGYPRKRLVFLGWGKPSLGSPPQKKEAAASPDSWMPIAGELSLPSGHPRLGKIREAAKKATSKQRPLEVSPLQKMLMGPHLSLPQLVESEAAHVKLIGGQPGSGSGAGGAGGGLPTGSEAGLGASLAAPTRKRNHRIYTAAAGFVRYSG